MLFRLTLTLSVLTERRAFAPYGLCGRSPESKGLNLLLRSNGVILNLGPKCSIPVHVGDLFRLPIPGGGSYGVRKMVPLKGPTQMDPSLPNLLKEDQFLNSSLSKSLLKSVTSKTKGELVDVNFILKSVEIGSGKFGGKLAASGILRRRTEMNNEVVHSRNIHESVRLVKSKVRPGCSCLHTPTATIYSDTVC